MHCPGWLVKASAECLVAGASLCHWNRASSMTGGSTQRTLVASLLSASTGQYPTRCSRHWGACCAPHVIWMQTPMSPPHILNFCNITYHRCCSESKQPMSAYCLRTGSTARACQRQYSCQTAKKRNSTCRKQEKPWEAAGMAGPHQSLCQYGSTHTHDDIGAKRCLGPFTCEQQDDQWPRKQHAVLCCAVLCCAVPCLAGHSEAIGPM